MERLRLWFAGWLFGHMALDFAKTIKCVSDRVDSTEQWVIELKGQLIEANAEIDRLRMLTTAEPAKKVFKPRGWREAMTLMEGNQ